MSITKKVLDVIKVKLSDGRDIQKYTSTYQEI